MKLVDQDLEQTILTKGATVEKALNTINNSSARIALIVSNGLKLVGTVTDGDVRRYMLSGGLLSDPVANVMKTDFISADDDATDKECRGIMTKRHVRQLPIIGDMGLIKGLFVAADMPTIKTKIPNVVVIMAGGQGLRLRPQTLTCPKPMIKINGVPILEIIINNCKKFGLYKFLISVNYLKEQIIEYFGDGSELGVDISYIEENTKLGTAGALSLIKEKLEHPIIVLNGDVLTKIDLYSLLSLHIKNENNFATLCVRQHLTEIPYGVVTFENGELLEIIEKPTLKNYVNAGVYVLEPSAVLDLVDNKYLDMPDLFDQLLANNKVISIFPIHEYWIDIGRQGTLLQALEEWV